MEVWGTTLTSGDKGDDGAVKKSGLRKVLNSSSLRPFQVFLLLLLGEGILSLVPGVENPVNPQDGGPAERAQPRRPKSSRPQPPGGSQTSSQQCSRPHASFQGHSQRLEGRMQS